MAGLPIPKKKAPEEDKEPVYQHQQFPKIVHKRDAKTGKLVESIVQDEAGLAKLAKAGWTESPADHPEPEEGLSADDQIAGLLDENEQLKAALAKATKGKG